MVKLFVKTTFTAVGGILVLSGLALVFAASQWDVWARKALERQLSKVLDTPVSVGAIVTHPVTKTFDITDLVISNPRAFNVGPAFEVPRISVAVDPATLFGSRIDFPYIHAHDAHIHLHYLPGTGSNVSVLMERARAWRESSHWGLRPPGYHVAELKSTNGQLTTHALGRSATVPLGDVTLTNIESAEQANAGAMAAAMLRRTVDEMLGAESVVEGLREWLGAEFEKWMGKTPI